MMLPIIKPMEPVSTNELEQSPNWIYQIKWDGVRILSNIEQGKVQLYTRKGNDRTHIYPEITQALQKLFKDQTLVLDGEMVALDDGRPSFFKLMKRDRLKNAAKIEQILDMQPVYYVIFDILYLKDRWLTDETLTYRLEVLDNLNKSINSSLIQFCPSSNNADLLFNFTKENGWEGIVMKERDGGYHLGTKYPTWRKLKHFQDTIANVIGIEFKSHRANSLLLAMQHNETWKYVGKAATGLSQKELTYLTNSIEHLVLENPLVYLPSYREKKVIWIKPLLKVRVQFLEYSPEGQLRSPVIKGFV